MHLTFELVKGIMLSTKNLRIGLGLFHLISEHFLRYIMHPSLNTISEKSITLIDDLMHSNASIHSTNVSSFDAEWLRLHSNSRECCHT